MHTFKMPQHVVDRIVNRRGKVHIFDRIDPRRTALVVVDLQNTFMMPGVAHALCEMAPHIVSNVNRLASAVRARGGTVVWIGTVADAEALRSWSVFYDMATPEMRKKRIDALTEGSIGHALWSGLDIHPEDLAVTKKRYSAFIQGSSDLERQLRSRDIDTVLITGTVTNVCCESTARDAMMLNFKTIMISDGNAAANDDEHAASLIAFYLSFGDVLTTKEAIAGMGADTLVLEAASA